MGVQRGVELARSMFGEASEDEAAGRLVGELTFVPSSQLGMLLEVGESRTDSPLVCLEDAVVAAYQRHDRHRFRRVDREIPAWVMLYPAVGAASSELLATHVAGEQILEDARFYRTG